MTKALFSLFLSSKKKKNFFFFFNFFFSSLTLAYYPKLTQKTSLLYEQFLKLYVMLNSVSSDNINVEH